MHYKSDSSALSKYSTSLTLHSYNSVRLTMDSLNKFLFSFYSTNSSSLSEHGTYMTNNTRVPSEIQVKIKRNKNCYMCMRSIIRLWPIIMERLYNTLIKMFLNVRKGTFSFIPLVFMLHMRISSNQFPTRIHLQTQFVW